VVAPAEHPSSSRTVGAGRSRVGQIRGVVTTSVIATSRDVRSGCNRAGRGWAITRSHGWRSGVERVVLDRLPLDRMHAIRLGAALSEVVPPRLRWVATPTGGNLVEIARPTHPVWEREAQRPGRGSVLNVAAENTIRARVMRNKSSDLLQCPSSYRERQLEWGGHQDGRSSRNGA